MVMWYANRAGKMTKMHQCIIAGLLQRLSGAPKLRAQALKMSLKMEGWEFYSLTARWIMEKRYGVLIGDYSYGDCFIPGAFPAGVTVGRYVSIGPGVRVFLRNHPLDRLSMHPFFYNSSLGFLKNDVIDSSVLEIGHDAWIGSQALILRGCSRIGIGAVIGAGAVVTKSVPDFAVAAGNPARIVRMRFTSDVCERILASRWWDRAAADCIQCMPEMILPLKETLTRHPLLQSR